MTETEAEARRRALLGEAARRLDEICVSLRRGLDELDSASVFIGVGLRRMPLDVPDLVRYLRDMADGIEQTGAAPTMN